MKYMLLIYGEDDFTSMDPQEFAELVRRTDALNRGCSSRASWSAPTASPTRPPPRWSASPTDLRPSPTGRTPRPRSTSPASRSSTATASIEPWRSPR